MITGRDLVQKLYSEQGEERTFSVEMDEETLGLFSDFCEELGIELKLFSEDNKDKETGSQKAKRIAGAAAGGIATGGLAALPAISVGGYLATKGPSKKLMQGIFEEMSEDEAEKLVKKIAKRGKLGALAGAGIAAGTGALVGRAINKRMKKNHERDNYVERKRREESDK